MERRDALKYTAMMMGVSLSTASVTAILSGCEVDTSPDWKPSFFTKEEIEFISILAETMLPRTTTPGAQDAMVDRYLDTVRPLRYTADENEVFKSKLQSFMRDAKLELGKDLVRVSPEERLAWLQEIDRKAYAQIQANTAAASGQKPFYIQLKEQILGGYFNAEIVAKEFFAFDPIPGRYEGCIPYDDIGKAWA